MFNVQPLSTQFDGPATVYIVAAPPLRSLLTLDRPLSASSYILLRFTLRGLTRQTSMSERVSTVPEEMNTAFGRVATVEE